MSIKSTLQSSKLATLKTTKTTPFGATQLIKLSTVNHKLMCTVSRQSLAADACSDGTAPRLCGG